MLKNLRPSLCRPCYTALKEVTSGFLRLKGEHDRLTVLFRGLPNTGAAKPGDPPEAETEIEG